MKVSKGFQIAFLIVGALTVLEFIFIRGMFTWLIAVFAVSILGIMNIILSIKNKDMMLAALYALATVALCMGYFMLS